MVAVVRVEEKVVEAKEVVRSFRPCHRDWVAMSTKESVSSSACAISGSACGSKTLAAALA